MPIFTSSQPRPFVIAGPCSAETREQVLETAAALSTAKVSLFRAGVWKPRTRPGHFEGAGAPALEWLQEARKAYGLPFTVEVGEPEHIEAALAAEADVLWIGARSTVNPFHVQRLADALRGVNIPVMVKNPVTPDADLWLGAIERLETAGIADLAAVHRGFSSYKASSTYRNTPNWPVPIELRRRRPDLFMICDPSHIAGRRDRIAEVAQKAMDMDYDGLMIETHPHPDQAWSDAAQQVTPENLAQVLQQLIIRKGNIINPEDNEIEFLRSLMDSVDAEIIDLVARRMELSVRLGEQKKLAGLTAYQQERWQEIVETRGNRAEEKKINSDFIVSVFEKIHHESVKLQLRILAK